MTDVLRRSAYWIRRNPGSHYGRMISEVVMRHYNVGGRVSLFRVVCGSGLAAILLIVVGNRFCGTPTTTEPPIAPRDARETLPLTPRQKSAATVLSLLCQMPNWTSLGILENQEQITRRAIIEGFVREIATFDLDSIREAIKAYLDGDEAITDCRGDKVFFFIRFIFELPETIPGDSSHINHLGGGWIGMRFRDVRQPGKGTVLWLDGLGSGTSLGHGVSPGDSAGIVARPTISWSCSITAGRRLARTRYRGRVSWTNDL